MDTPDTYGTTGTETETESECPESAAATLPIRVPVHDDEFRGTQRFETTQDLSPVCRTLPPLETGPRVDTSPRGGALPPIAPGPLGGTTTRGGMPEKSDAAIISVPEGDGYVPEQTYKAGPIVSVPGGDAPSTLKVPPRDGYARSPNKPLDMVIYFMDKSGIQLSVEDGQHAEAGELFEMVMEEMKFPAVAREVFSLWLVSDLLELQLKPNQVPFKLVCYWEELLEKYTDASEQDIERDEPVITFQRNAFYSRYDERKLRDSNLIRLLYFEAKENIIDARYPLESEQYDRQAGLQALIRYREFDPNRYTTAFFKPIIKEFYPEIRCRKKFTFGKSKDGPEHRIPDAMTTAHNKYGSLREAHAYDAACREYLKFCWTLPFYGAAFFSGQIEHPVGKYRLRTVEDDPVYIAVNTDGVFVLDMDDTIFLLGLKFEDLSWEYAEPKDRSNQNCVPCLFLQFRAREQGEQVTKLLQVFSRQAVLADGMIEACIQLKKQKTLTLDQTDGLGDVRMQACDEVWKKFDRLCLATFNSKGDCISNKTRGSTVR